MNLETLKTVLDPKIILTNLMDDKELSATIFEGFLADIPIQIKALEDYLKEQSAKDVERQAHTIKGASANVGATALQDIAFEMEKAGKAGDLDAVQDDIPELLAGFATLKKAIEQVLEEWKE